MNAMTKNVTSAVERDGVLAAHFFVRGKLVQRPEVTHRSRDLGASFTTPAIDFDGLIQPRSERPPLLDVKVSEIVDFLVAVGERLRLDSNPYLQESLERVAATIPLPDRILERMFDRARLFMTHETLMAGINASFSSPAYLDGWVSRTDCYGQRGALRAFPSRLVHILAGNSPASCVL